MSLSIVIADYDNAQHGADIVALLDDYARDPMGGNEPISANARENLIALLKQVPGAFSVLCYYDGQAAGLANCFMGFSTFKCKPLINIHDLAVRPQFRGKQISQHLLDKVEAVALERHCCKITLEVLDGNQVAKNAYQKFGFAPYQLVSEAGQALFWQKALV